MTFTVGRLPIWDSRPAVLPQQPHGFDSDSKKNALYRPDSSLGGTMPLSSARPSHHMALLQGHAPMARRKSLRTRQHARMTKRMFVCSTHNCLLQNEENRGKAQRRCSAPSLAKKAGRFGRLAACRASTGEALCTLCADGHALDVCGALGVPTSAQRRASRGATRSAGSTARAGGRRDRRGARLPAPGWLPRHRPGSGCPPPPQAWPARPAGAGVGKASWLASARWSGLSLPA